MKSISIYRLFFIVVLMCFGCSTSEDRDASSDVAYGWDAIPGDGRDIGDGFNGTEDSLSQQDGDSGLPDTGNVPCVQGTIRCQGNAAVECIAPGVESEPKDCTDQTCVINLGCRECVPGTSICEGEQVMSCNTEGSEWMAGPVCDLEAKQQICLNGECIKACDYARMTKSYVGCDYWSVVTPNAVKDDFHFAVVIANPHPAKAEVKIEGIDYTGTIAGDAILITRIVNPKSTETILLPWNIQLKTATLTGNIADLRTSLKQLRGAYKITTNLPVVAYQFNPLEFEHVAAPSGCTSASQCIDPLGYTTTCDVDGACHFYSFSNDASLLIPTHALGKNYISLGYPSMIIKKTGEYDIKHPTFVTVVGVEDGTQIHVKTGGFAYRLNHTGVYETGDEDDFTLNGGDVLLLTGYMYSACADYVQDGDYRYCRLNGDYDLTGTTIDVVSGGSIAVFTGAECSFVPFNKWACDHLEEQNFPVDAWGTILMGTHTHYDDPAYPNLYRIIVDRPETSIRFSDEALQGLYGGIYHPGDIVQFESTENFIVHTLGEGDTPTGKLQLAEFYVGQKYSTDAVAKSYNGDPAFMFSVPTEQFRNDYLFLTPLSFEEEWANVIAKKGAKVFIDDNEVTGWRDISGSDYQVAPFRLGSQSDADRKADHQATSEEMFGLLIYGLADYSSYMYPAGLNLIPIKVK